MTMKPLGFEVFYEISPLQNSPNAFMIYLIHNSLGLFIICNKGFCRSDILDGQIDNDKGRHQSGIKSRLESE